MQHKKITFTNITAETSEILVAMLADLDYTGFEEGEGTLAAYITEDIFEPAALAAIAGSMDAAYHVEDIAPQNWNALWESNFQPVVIEGICTIRADFHDIAVTTPYTINITPKMSFGTGHHATTRLMMQLINGNNMAGKRVLDFGTGTGVLAIFAAYRGAQHVLAIDNDEWSVENAAENVARNNCSDIEVKSGSLEAVNTGGWQVILANINRHILLQYMAAMYSLMDKDALLLLSGLLVDDEGVIKDAAQQAGFTHSKTITENGWIAMKFSK